MEKTPFRLGPLQVISVILALLGAVTGPLVLICFAAMWLACFAYCQKALDDPKERQRLRRWLLDYPDRARAYRWMVGGILGRLQSYARPKSRELTPAPDTRMAQLNQYLSAMTATETEAVRVSVSPWEWPVLDFAFRLALVYPFLFLVVQWLILGTGTGFGTVELFRDATVAGRIGTMVIVFAVLFILSDSFDRVGKERFGLPWWSGIAIIVALIWILPRIGVDLQDDLFPNVVALVAIVPILKVGLTSSALLSGGLVIGISVTMASATLLIGHSAWLAFGAFVASLVLLFPAGMLVGFACMWLVRRDAGFLAYTVLSVCWLAVMGGIAAFLAGREVHYLLKVGFLFLCVLPVVNAWFDYLSYGLTLTLVRWGLRTKGWMAAVYAVLDVGLAMLMFSLLGITVTIVLATVNRYVAPDFYPLAPVFDGAAQGDPKYFWLYAMIFSTFVPTFLHMMAASLSLVSVLPRRQRQRLWQMYCSGQDDMVLRTIGCLGLGLLASVAAALPLVFAWGGLHLLLGSAHTIGGGYLLIFKSIAAALGEPV